MVVFLPGFPKCYFQFKLYACSLPDISIHVLHEAYKSCLHTDAREVQVSISVLSDWQLSGFFLQRKGAHTLQGNITKSHSEPMTSEPMCAGSEHRAAVKSTVKIPT